MTTSSTQHDTNARATNGRIVVYTAIFGKKDVLITPTCVPKNADFVCFTDQPLRSKVWDIRRVEAPIEGDMTRSNRYYKILAHKIFPEYEQSVYVDGNILVRGDVQVLLDTYLDKANMAALDHAKWKEVPLSNFKELMEQLYKMEQAGKHQEDETLLRRQATHYLAEGFPEDTPLTWNCVLLRRHHSPDVIRAMEAWWKELNEWSKRDQVSFNYVAWKTGLVVAMIPEDGSDNPYTKRLNHRLTLTQKVRSHMIAATKRLSPRSKR